MARGGASRLDWAFTAGSGCRPRALANGSKRPITGEVAVGTANSDRREAAGMAWSGASGRWRQEGGRGHGVARLRLWRLVRTTDDDGDGAFVVLVSNGSREVPHDLLANRW
uniref:Uncharacterized protein n=1 Tax=Oryza sativa subsp. japonica TaxID=39947 RepID=Q6YYB4_ORYSJ|nr:hypothetical protein [Oryza sativa Japonica Group]BAD16314.1 hypothetical protein [Oryza sativa Japonica Group]